MPEDSTPAVAGRPVVDPALLLAALARLRAATGGPAPTGPRPDPSVARSRGTRAVDPALRPAVTAPAIRHIPGARAGTPVLIPTGLAAMLKSGYSARVEHAPAHRSSTEPNGTASRPT